MSKKPRYYESKKIENIRSGILASERQYGQRPAIWHKEKGSFVSTSYSELRYMIEGLGTELLRRDLADKFIIVTGDNSLEWALVYLTVTCGLGVIVPVDKELPEEELANVAADCGAAAIFCSDRIFSKADALGGDIMKFRFSDIAQLIDLGQERLGNGDTEYLQRPIDEEALAVLLFTSGTTGMSKGVMLSQRNICTDVTEISHMFWSEPDDIYLSVLPLHHTYECTCSLLHSLCHGSSIAFCEGLRYITRNMQEIRPTIICCVPMLAETIYKRILNNIKRKGPKTEKTVRTLIKMTGSSYAIKKRVFSEIHDSFGGRLRLIISGGAPIDPEVLKGLRELGFMALQGYGLTECSPIAAVNKDDWMKDDAAGLSVPHGVIDIYDVQADGTGEIRFKGDNVMLGYWKNPQATAEVLRDGWFYTGDLGYLDKDSFLHITGRKKNVIVTNGGKNVFPEELEAYLMRNPFVAAAVVVGYENESKGDYDIVAVLQPDSAAFTEAYGRGYSAGQIEAEFSRAVSDVNGLVQHYKNISYFVPRLEDFRRNASQKILRADVAEESRAEYLRRLARD